MYEPRTAACGAGMKSCFLEMVPHSRVIATKWVASHHLNLYALRLSPVASLMSTFLFFRKREA